MPAGKHTHPVFISHASANLAAASQHEQGLDDAGLDPWLDYSVIRAGALLASLAEAG